MPLRVECAPAFDYARATHETTLVTYESIATQNGAPRQKKAVFKSDGLTLDLRFVTDTTIDNVSPPSAEFQLLDLSADGHKGPAISMDLDLVEGQVVVFVLRTPPVKESNVSIVQPSEEQAEQMGIPLERKYRTIPSESQAPTLFRSI